MTNDEENNMIVEDASYDIDYCFISFCNTNFVISYTYSIYLFYFHSSININIIYFIHRETEIEKIV